MIPRSISFALVLSLLLIFPFCRKSEKRLPLVTTTVTSAGVKEATCSGVLYSPGDAEVTEKGVCWSTGQDVNISHNRVVCNTEEKTFTAEIRDLLPTTTYYARAYAKSELGISYGKVVSFRTLSINFPSLYLYYSFGAEENSVQVTMQVNQSFPFSYKAGVCWSKNPAPTVDDTIVQLVEKKHTDAVTPYSTYPLDINDLEESTTYYARAYCTSSLGTIYSNTSSWTTATPLNPVSFSLSTVGHTDASFLVNVANINPSDVNSTGICWSQNPQPTISNDRNEEPNMVSKIFTMESLEINTTYYVRAYITTDTKVIYAPAQQVVRTYYSTVTDINGNVYNTVEIAGQEWMASNYRASSFNNGTSIPLLKPNTSYNQWVNTVNSQIPAYCYYNDNASYNIPYGKLYPKYVAQDPTFPPTGWRLPTAADWQALAQNVGSLADLSHQKGWSGQHSDITNAYGFSLYAGGYWDSGFMDMGSKTRFWVMTLTPSIFEDNSFHFFSYDVASVGWFQSGDAQSVRFIKE